MGYGVVMLEATVVSNSFGLPSEQALISKLSTVVGWIMVGWLVIRWADLLDRGDVSSHSQAISRPRCSGSRTRCSLAAVLVFLTPAGRASQRASFLGAVALLAGGCSIVSTPMIGAAADQQLELLPFGARADGHDRHHLRSRCCSISSSSRCCPCWTAQHAAGMPNRRLLDPHHDRPHHPHRGASAHRL